MVVEKKLKVERNGKGKLDHFFFELRESLLSTTRLLFSKLFGEEQCCVCGRNSGFIPICKTCKEKYLFSFVSHKEKRCSVCGRELLSENSKCMSCRKDPVLQNTDFVFPLYSYRLWKKMLLFIWKIQNKRALSSVFAEAVYKALLLIFPYKIPPVVPVPPRPFKIRNRGWDQINDLCIYLSKRYGIEIVDLLERTTFQQQKKLDRLQRLETKGKSYILKPYNEILKKCKNIPKEVVLLDDVLTTGITVENCAFLLKKIGVLKVNVLTLFIVD